MIFPYKLKLVEAVSSIQLIERIYEWTPFDPLKPVQDFPFVRIFVRMFLTTGGHRGDHGRFLFLRCQISLLAL